MLALAVKTGDGAPAGALVTVHLYLILLVPWISVACVERMALVVVTFVVFAMAVTAILGGGAGFATLVCTEPLETRDIAAAV